MAVPSLPYGPMILKADDIASVEERPGIYVLGYYVPKTPPKNLSIRRTGRSDKSLRQRLLQYIQTTKGAEDSRLCSYAFFDYRPDADEAYLGECELFHHYTPKNNTDHPDKPRAAIYCPVKGCKYAKP